MVEEFVTVKGKKYYVIGGNLDLHDKKISDIAEIKGLKNLTHLRDLDLSNNQIGEIKGLEHLTELKILDLRENRIIEIKGLEHLTNLEVLLIDKNPIKKEEWNFVYGEHEWDGKLISGAPVWRLVEYSRLKSHNLFVTIRKKKYYVDVDEGELNLNGKEITSIDEITGLEKLKDLEILHLDWNQITEIKGLENLVSLKELNLHCNEIEEIKGLSRLSKLERLSLYNNQIKEIKGLENLNKLRILRLKGNPIEEIKGLEHLTNLKVLQLNTNLLSGYEKNLLRYNAQMVVKYCQHQKEDTLLHLPFVTVRGENYYVDDDKLSLWGIKLTNIAEIKGLENFINLKSLKLSANRITTISKLDQLKDLQKLELNENKIREINGLENLTNLKELDLSGNQIEEIKGLENLINLEKLDLFGNPIREYETHLIDRSAQEVVKYCQEKASKTHSE